MKDNKEEKIINKMKHKIIEEDQMIDQNSKIEMTIMKKKWVNKDIEDNKEKKITIKIKLKIIEEGLMVDKKNIKNNFMKMILI